MSALEACGVPSVFESAGAVDGGGEADPMVRDATATTGDVDGGRGEDDAAAMPLSMNRAYCISINSTL